MTCPPTTSSPLFGRHQFAVSCARATYHRAGRRIECTGGAQLRQGADRVSGQTVEFDLAADRVTVTGRTRLQLGARTDAERAVQ